MDPNACLEELRLLVLAQQNEPEDVEQSVRLRYLRKRERETLPVGRRADPARMAELFDALDKWLVRGGFPPTAWAQRAGTVRT
jgi:hypothetical protein